MEQRRGTADVVLEVIAQPRLEFRVRLGVFVGRGELVERVHQGLGHEPAAERAEPAERVGALEEAVHREDRGRIPCRGLGRTRHGRGHRGAFLRRVGHQSFGFVETLSFARSNAARRAVLSILAGEKASGQGQGARMHAGGRALSVYPPIDDRLR